MPAINSREKKKALKIFVYISWRARLERDRSRRAMQAEKFHFYSMNNKRNRGEVGKVFFSSFSLSLPQLEARNAQVKNCLEKHDRLPPNRKPSGVSEWENEVMPHGDGVEKLFSCQNYHGASRKKKQTFSWFKNWKIFSSMNHNLRDWFCVARKKAAPKIDNRIGCCCCCRHNSVFHQ